MNKFQFFFFFFFNVKELIIILHFNKKKLYVYINVYNLYYKIILNSLYSTLGSYEL
jgi:hypothetical protein